MYQFISLVGSHRPRSVNAGTTHLIEQTLEASGDTCERIDIATLELSIYSQVVEQQEGQPKGADRLRRALRGASGLIIGCPEYNGFMPPLLLNALTWATRNEDGQSDLSPFRLKPVLLCASSPGSLGGIRAVGHLATYLLGIGSQVYPDFFLIPGAFGVFDEKGETNDDHWVNRAQTITQNFREHVGRGEDSTN